MTRLLDGKRGLGRAGAHALAAGRDVVVWTPA
jgi:hypothetical protein